MKKLFLSLLLTLGAGSLVAQPYRIAVIPKGTTHEYWQAAHAGVMKAQGELEAAGIKVEITWKGPLREDDRDQQIQVLENFMGRRVHGIVLSPLDARALVAPVESAVKGKIPVVIFDSALNSKLPASYVATDNVEGGRIAGRHLAKLIGGKGNVIMLRYSTGSASTEQREEGFLEVMKKEFPDIKLLSVDQHAGVTRDSAYRTSQNLLNRFGRTVNGVFAVNLPSTAGMLLAIKDAGLVGKVKFVGFDATAPLIASLKAGECDALVVQDPFKMGYLGVKTVVAVLRGEKVEPVIDTGVTLVTKENLDDPAVAELINPPIAKYLK